jgi:hypothetical protein
MITCTPITLGVVLQVPEVLDILHDRQQDAEVPLPHEDLVDILHLAALQQLLQLPVLVGQQDHGHLHARVAQAAGKLQHLHVPHIRGHQDHVVAAAGKAVLLLRLPGLPPRGQHREGPAGPGHPGDLWGVIQIHVDELAEDQVLQLSVPGPG